MKKLIKLLSLGIMLVSCNSIVNAQTLIYSNSFNASAVDINGTAPTYAIDFAGGSSGASWDVVSNAPGASPGYSAYQNGTVGLGGNTVLLPFTPQFGYVYTLSGSVTFTADPGNWLSMGFGANLPVPNTVGSTGDRFNDPGVNGNPWSLFRPGTGNGGVQLYWSRTALVGSQVLIPTTFPNTNTISIVLDTSGLKWVISEYVNGTLVTANFTYGGNPTINSIGYCQTKLTTAGTYHWNNFTFSALAVPMAAVTNNTYWVAPTAVGTGDGSSSANAASFLSASFWGNAQNVLQFTNVTVNFNDGTYSQGELTLANMGNAVHQLTLQAVNLYQPVFTSNPDAYIYMPGSQNIKFYGLTFSGAAKSWGVDCITSGIYPCRNLEFSYCQFTNLTGVMYAALGLLNGTRDILVDNCTFANLTANNGNHQHMIYGSHDIVGVVATNCSFTDCYADFVRFRDDSEYCTVENSAFTSTTAASVWPFISCELFQVSGSDSIGDEFFGNSFQIINDSFNYNASGTGPRAALHFSDDGYSPQSYNCALTSAQATWLGSGATATIDKQAFLQTNMGIFPTAIKMFGNTYNSGVDYHVDYTYIWDGTAPWNSWQGTIGISVTPDSSGALLGKIPVLRNGNFDRQGLLLTSISAGLKNNECLFRNWYCLPQYTTILQHAGFNGTPNALMLNNATAQTVYQWITPPGPTWTLDFLFAMDSGFTGTGTKFKVDLFHDDLSGSKVSVGVNDQGRFGIYNNGTFITLPALGTVSFSANNVYRIRIVGNYAAATPYVNIYTSDANNPALTHQALGLSYWIGSGSGGTPISGQSSPETIAFYNYNNTVIVDQVALATGLGEQPPVITNSVYLNNGQFALSGTNGFAGDNYYLLSSTNLTSGNWTLETTNIFDANGAFSITNVVTPGAPQEFYRLQVQ